MKIYIFIVDDFSPRGVPGEIWSRKTRALCNNHELEGEVMIFKFNYIFSQSFYRKVVNCKNKAFGVISLIREVQNRTITFEDKAQCQSQNLFLTHH